MFVFKNQPTEGSLARRKAAKPSLRLNQALIALVASMGLASVHGATKPVHASKAKPASPAASNASKHARTAANKARLRTREGAGAASKTAGVTDDGEATPQSGLGSWYGNYFHGKQTASGELFNMYAFTAAHRTLPIPSYARVRNLDNGKEVIVRVNDRGPYVGRRLIDLSMAAAQKLGIQGLGRVRIEPVSTDDILSGKWREEDIRPSGPSESGEASVATVAPVKLAEDAGLPRLDAPIAGREPLSDALPELNAADLAASSPSTDIPGAALTRVEADPSLPEGPRPSDESTASPITANEPSERGEAPEAAGVAPAVKHTPRGRSSTPTSATLVGSGVKDGKEAKDSAAATATLGTAHPVPTPATTTGAADVQAPVVASRASAPAQASSALAATQGSAMPGGSAALPTLPAAAPIAAAASAAGSAPLASLATAPPRDVSEAGAATLHAAAAPSILATVAATVVTPVLSGIARSATELKDTVVNFALSRPAQRQGAVQIDPARTSNGKGWWLQLGVFEQSANAMSFQHKVITLAPWLGPLMGIFDERGEQKLQAGPYPSREQAQQALERAREALKVNPVMVQRR